MTLLGKHRIYHVTARKQRGGRRRIDRGLGLRLRIDDTPAPAPPDDRSGQPAGRLDGQERGPFLLPPAAVQGDRAKPKATGVAKTAEAIDHGGFAIVILGET